MSFRPETLIAIDAVTHALTDASGLPVIGEERGGEAATGSAYWLLDPICGTRNFASGIPLYCVNLAMVERDEITVAVVGDASTGGIDVAVVFSVPALHAGAGSLLITEAGGVVSDIDGGRWTIESDSLVGSANRRLHDDLLELTA